MGTSTSYDAPTSWSALKAKITRAAGSGGISRETARNIIADHISNNGGARGWAHGGRRGGVGTGNTARQIAAGFGLFISTVGQVGLNEALRKSGLQHLVGQPVKLILDGLLVFLGGSGSAIDDVDARMALSHLRDKLLSEATSAEEVEKILQNQLNNIDELLRDYFSFYLFEQFCRVYFERLEKNVGAAKAYSFLNEINDFLGATLHNRTFDRNLASIDWAGEEGKRLVTEIMQTTFEIFGA